MLRILKSLVLVADLATQTRKPMRRSLLPESVERYVTREVTVVTPLQARLRAETAKLPNAGMQISADQGALLALLVRMIGARLAL